MVVAAVVTLAATSAGAATYYVSQSTGNDRWSGTAANPNGNSGPWKTLLKASTIEYAPGDRILLKCGDTWNEELSPQGNGTPGFAKGTRTTVLGIDSEEIAHSGYDLTLALDTDDEKMGLQRPDAL